MRPGPIDRIAQTILLAESVQFVDSPCSFEPVKLEATVSRYRVLRSRVLGFFYFSSTAESVVSVDVITTDDDTASILVGAAELL